jgi:hypothetical protein
MGAVGRLHIERFRTEYVVPAGHPAPERLRCKLDEAARRNVPEVLRAALGPWLDSTDESVWIVRCLEVDLAVNAAWEPDRAGRRWAGQVAQAITRTLSEDGDPGVIRFADRTSYLVQFLRDLASGDAWGRWYYEGFAGLRALPTATALRTAILNDAELGLRALLRLATHDRGRVLDALSPLDARRVLDELPEEAAATDEPRWWNALARAWSDGRVGPIAAHTEARTALELYLAVCDAAPGSSGPALRVAVRATVRLARLLADAKPSRARDIVQALADPDPARFYLVLGFGDAELLRPLRDAPPGWVQAIVDRTSRITARPEAASGSGTGANEVNEIRHTPFGGVFLLLPQLDRLPLEAAVQDWPSAGEADALQLVRLLLLVKCCGRNRAERAFRDPLLRDLLAISPMVTPAVLRRWERELSLHALDRFLSVIAAWRRENGTARANVLALCRVPLRGAPAALLLEAETGVWLWGRGYPPGRPEVTASRVATWLDTAGIQPTQVLTDLEFESHLDARQPSRNQLSADVGYLAAPAALGLSRRVDLALSIVAQGVLRAVAARLPGFVASSPSYLFSNFLDIGGSLQDEPARRVVGLGKPPLQLVLAMSGLARGEYRLSWLPDRPFVLFQGEG